MRHYRDEWIQEWCDRHGWTEPMLAGCDFYWAFPPGGVMPEPIPSEMLRLIKAEKGWTTDEQFWVRLTLAVSLATAAISGVTHCPLPLVVAFIFAAVTVARLEVEV